MYIYIYKCAHMFIRMHARTSCYIAMSLLHHIQLTADIHTTAITSHSKPLACPPPPEEYGGWATGWRRAPTLHPLAMPDTWQSGRVHIAHLPPPKETGGGRDERCNGG